MQTTVRMRISEEMKGDLQRSANKNRSSVSKEVREALAMYIDGKKELSATQGHTLKNTTFVCDAEDLLKFKDIAKEAGISFDEAVRTAIAEYLSEHNRRA